MNVGGLFALVCLWLALAGPTLGQLVLGTLVAVASLWVTDMHRAQGPPFRLVAWLRLLASLAAELLLSNLRVAAHVIRPTRRFRPAILAVPLTVTSDAQITVLANMLTITPGTAVIDIAPDRSALYVHVLHAPDPDATIRSIQEGFERRVREASA